MKYANAFCIRIGILFFWCYELLSSKVNLFISIGTTHFCEPCHNIWQQRQQQEKDGKVPQCTKEDCKLGREHPPNGQEYGMGCSACMYEIEIKK